ncbi:MAG TPA: S-methyl-5'-thioadenosine phosphorylase [Candidatus Methanoperedens sp.]|nr:S-methyl-5'-thioadenosine phosphorylase [Candidatus Methanoperedens sp.]
MEQASIGVIGGSGLYRMPDLDDVVSVAVDTPFGAPSDELVVGTLEGRRVAFLPRHGRGHRLLPSEVPYLANIHALRQLGVGHVISVSAVGSMREEIAPGHICIPDQFIDLTKGRPRTFFGGGVVCHIPFDKPVCAELADVLYRAGKKAGAVMHKGGTYVCIEGPQFSTLAESRLYRSWNVDVIGMTNLPEARLAREAELCFATLALATDYDCWHETEEVSVEQILKIINQNVKLAQEIIRRAVGMLPQKRGCACPAALAHAIITDRAAITDEARRRLDLLLGRHLAG